MKLFRCKLLLMTLLVSACGSPSGSSIGKFTRDANLPLYFTVAGARAGQGAVYRINDLKNGRSEPELVISGLDFPTGIAMDTTGRMYIAEKLPAPYGKVKTIAPASTDVTVLAEGLDNPSALAVDTFNHLYVVEGDAGRIQRTDASGALGTFISSGVGNPRGIFIDDKDQVFTSDASSGNVFRTAPDGTTEKLVSNLASPFGLSADLTGAIYVLLNNTGAADGQIGKISPDGNTTAVVSDLNNPIAVTSDLANGLFFIEGAPANRIVSYSFITGELRIIAEGLANPYAIIMTPF